MNTLTFSFLLLAFAFLVTANQVSFQVNYELRDGDLYPHGYVTGTVYYRYDTANLTDARIRYMHSVSYSSGRVVIQEFEDYNKKERYTICNGQCEASGFNWKPQQWWYKEGDVKGTTEGDYSHYTRSSNSDSVTDLWLRDTTLPTDKTVREIVLTTGRHIKLVPGTFRTYSYNGDVFEKNYGGVNCGNVTCKPKFMDVFFVLDESGSVTSKNWVKMLNFIGSITDKLTISSTAAAIGVSAFGGRNHHAYDCYGKKYTSISDKDGKWVNNCDSVINKTYDIYGLVEEEVIKPNVDPSKSEFYSEWNLPDVCCKKWDKSGYWAKCPPDQFNYERCRIDVRQETSGCNGGGSNTYVRCDGAFKKTTGSDLFESELLMPLTVDTNENIKKAVKEFSYLKTPCPTYYNPNKMCDLQAGTCQALGLKKAIEAFNRDEASGRAHTAGKIPERFVIVMTDGDDHCAALTKEYAEILKTQHNVKLYEVSIGLKQLYDKDLLMNMSTKFNGEPSYFDVTDFDGLNTLLDKLVNEVCSESKPHESTACGDCLGFCGCGTCYCPDCESSETDKCHTYSCSADSANIVFGCKEKNVTCDDGDACTADRCDPVLGCKSEKKQDCMKDKTTCEYSYCNPQGSGDCSETEYIDSVCYNETYPEGCYVAACQPRTEGADATTGCKFTYQCDGDFPAVFNGNEIVEGCYTYSCEVDDEGKHYCKTVDHCKDMSNGCETYTCDPNVGKCMKSWERTCETDNCVAEVACNPNANDGKYCQYRNKTTESCFTALLDQASQHYGEDKWPASASAAQKYYLCGEISCIKEGNGAGYEEWDYVDGCAFVKNDEDCGMCSTPREGELDTHETTMTCLESLAKHQRENDMTKCYNVSCVPDGTGSRCEYGVALTCKPTACYDVVCNQTTMSCEYSMTERFKNAKEANTDMCKNVYCNEITGEPYTVDNSTDYCPPPEDKCKILDHCVAKDRSCIYKLKYTRENCTVTTCDSTTGVITAEKVNCSATNGCFESNCEKELDRCVERRIDDEKKCGSVDNCHISFCDVNTGDCVVEAKSYPNETNLCNNYTCVPTNKTDDGSENSEPLWIVSPKCVVSDICHTMTCSVLDGVCREYERVCDELDMEGYGDCYRAKCSTKRKGGCYRKVSPKSIFDECGNCIRGYSADDSTPVSQEELSACKDALKPYVPAAIGAGVIVAIVIACIIGAAAVTTAGTLATRELIRRARAANNQGAHDNPLFEEDGQEMENPTFVGTE